MQMRVGARGNAWALALAAAWSCAVPGTLMAGPVKVSVGGTTVEAHARAVGETVVGDVLPVLSALGSRAELSDPGQMLRGTTFDGRSLEAAPGAVELRVGGVSRPLALPLALEGGRLVGPLADVAAAVGCRAWHRKAAGELRIAARLTQVEAHAADEGAVVHIRTTGPTDAKLLHLTDPPRAYADLAGIAWTGASESIRAGGTGGLEGIRWSLYQEWPPIARIVVDLAPGAQVRMLPAQDGLLVVTVRPATEPAPAAAPAETPDAPPPSLEGVHVVLDPAGGGEEVGARGAGTTEKAVTLDIALRAAMALMELKALVTLTRDADRPVAPQVREELICSVAPDLVVRLACAAGNPEEQGIRTRYAPGAAALGQALQSALIAATGATDRGATEVAETAAGTPMAPDVACTVGHLSSPTEGKLLASAEYRKKLAQAVAAGIAAYRRP